MYYIKFTHEVVTSILILLSKNLFIYRITTGCVSKHHVFSNLGTFIHYTILAVNSLKFLTFIHSYVKVDSFAFFLNP